MYKQTKSNGQSVGMKKRIASICLAIREQTEDLLLLFQVISRGKIQSWQVQDVEMLAGSLPIDAEHLVDPVSSPAEGTVTGKIDFPVSLPPTASPTVNVSAGVSSGRGRMVEGGRMEGWKEDG